MGRFAAVIAEAGAADARDFRLRRRRVRALCALICAQARQRVARELRVAFRHLPYQFEKQRKRARAHAFMLHCTMLR